MDFAAFLNNLGFGLTVTLIGIAIVFLGLTILIGLIKLMEKATANLGKGGKKGKKQAEAPAPAPVAAPDAPFPAVAAPPRVSPPVVSPEATPPLPAMASPPSPSAAIRWERPVQSSFNVSRKIS